MPYVSLRCAQSPDVKRSYPTYSPIPKPKAPPKAHPTAPPEAPPTAQPKAPFPPTAKNSSYIPLQTTVNTVAPVFFTYPTS